MAAAFPRRPAAPERCLRQRISRHEQRSATPPLSARDKAEALFAAPKPPAPESVTQRTALPGARELVSLRIDSDVLEHFQSDGPGWQDRINAALRRVAGL